MEKIPILLIFLGHVWVDASQGILPIVLVKMKDVFALTYLQVGIVTSVLNFTSSMIQPIAGYVADRYRLSWFIPSGIMWTAICMGLLGWAPNYYALLILVGFAGLGTAAFHPRAMMTVNLLSGDRKGLGTAIFSTGGNLGFAIGPIVGGFLVLGLGLRATAGLILPGLLVAFTILLYRGKILGKVASPQIHTGAASKEELLIPWIPLILVCLIVTLRSWVYMSFITYLPLFLQGQGVELRKASLLLTVFLAGGAVAGLYGGHLSDRIGRKAVIIVSMLFYPIFTSMMILSTEPWLWVLTAASGASLLASFSVTIVLAQELLPRNLGLASGLILGLGFGTGGLGVAVSGWIADHVGLYQTLWIMALVPVTISLMAAFIKPPPQKAALR
ncbi:MAG: MFS transporter [Desulfobacteraceae bacterium]|nr:MAG: MFS transporter [Desulfobacteraceae bacterium]